MFARANKANLVDKIAQLEAELAQAHPSPLNGKFLQMDFTPEWTQTFITAIEMNFTNRTFTDNYFGSAAENKLFYINTAYIYVLHGAEFETIKNLFNTKPTSDWLNSDRCSYLKNRDEKLWLYAGLRLLQEVLEKPELLPRLFALQFTQVIKFAITELIVDIKEKNQQGKLHIGLVMLDLAVKHQNKEIAALMYRYFIPATDNQLNAMHTMGIKIAEINQEREQEILAKQEALEIQQRTGLSTTINTEDQLKKMQKALGANFNNQVVTYALYEKLEQQNNILQNRVHQLEQQMQILIAKISNLEPSDKPNLSNPKFFN